jgi:CP family cyanate transporter-like MFS transporter
MERQGLWAACLLLWLGGVATRLALLAVPPVITTIQADLALSGTQVGILSGLPVVVFALFALPGSLVIARLGVAAALVVGLLTAAAGAALRSAVPSIAVLYAGTVVMGAGIAMLHVALPAAVRAWTPQRIGFATALYTNGLLVGEIVPVALTIPWLLPLAGGSWRLSLALWGAPLVLFAALVPVLAPRPAAPVRLAAPALWWPDWRSGLLWRLGFVFASITGSYFGANAFLPAHLTQAGAAGYVAPALTALNAAQIPASLILLVVAGRLTGRAGPLVAIGVASVACVAGMALTAGAATVVFAGILGFVLAGALTLALTLPAFMSAPQDMARVTAGMFTISYLTSVSVSVLAGAAWDASGAPRAAFAVLVLGALPLVLLTPTIPFHRHAKESA